MQGGDISPASLGFSSDVAIFNASIAVDAAGDVLINFTASGNLNGPVGLLYRRGRQSELWRADALSGERAPLVQPLNSAGLVRWGNNSTAVADPSNPNAFWISNEYVQAGIANNYGEPAWWSTVTSQVMVSRRSPPTVADHQRRRRRVTKRGCRSTGTVTIGGNRWSSARR